MFYKKNRKNGLLVDKQGFTLVELLVVVAIIGLLSGMVMLSINSVKAKTRDTQRVTDMNSINTVLNLYHTTYFAYPIFDGFITGTDDFSTTLKNSELINTVPTDPLNSGDYRYYYQSVDGQDFYLQYYLETNSINGKNSGQNYIVP